MSHEVASTLIGGGGGYGDDIWVGNPLLHSSWKNRANGVVTDASNNTVVVRRPFVELEQL